MGEPAQVQCSHLLIKNVNSRNPVSRRTNASTSGVSEEQAREQLEELKKELTPDNFAEYAQQWSDCGSYKQGGDLGPFKKGEMMNEFWVGTIALEIGQIGDIVKTDSGLHLILRTG